MPGPGNGRRITGNWNREKEPMNGAIRKVGALGVFMGILAYRRLNP